MALLSVILMITPAFAEFSEYDTQTYDIDTLGVPKFINTNYIDLTKITQISKFRSLVGHDYSDNTQFGPDAVHYGQTIEACRSMKHYLIQPDGTAKLWAPVSGIISRIFVEGLGLQIHITATDQPAFTIIIFHINAVAPLAVGDHVTEGQLLGTHIGSQTYSDIAVAVHTPKGYQLISYFETLTDAAFAPFRAGGIASPGDLIISRATRDAGPTFCTTGPITSAGDIVALTPTGATQTITVSTPLAIAYHVGDPTLTVQATASSGLPVSMTARPSRVCGGLVGGVTLNWYRRGTCTVTFTQDGDATRFAAPTVTRTITVLAPGVPPPTPPRLGAVFPPSATGSQSYLRFISGGAGGKVTLSLTNAATGQVALRWTSPTIAPYAAPQYSIADIEAAAPAGYVRPAMYGLKIEPETTLGGYLQHVLYHPADGTLTNLSTCDYGVTANPAVAANIHTSRLGALGFPSSLVVHNLTGLANADPSLSIYDAGTGAKLGTWLSTSIFFSQESIVFTMPDLEQKAHISPGSLNHYVMTAGYGSFMQHLVTNERAGVITDMTAVCALDGVSNSSVGEPAQGGMLFSSKQQASQSFLRFYNAFTYPATARISLYDPGTGRLVGDWTTPVVAPNTELQVAVGTIEDAIGQPKRDTYVFSVSPDFGGYFQHVLWRTADGTLTNLSTCTHATDNDPFTLIGVHSSLIGSGGYPSSVVVNNTGAVIAPVTLGIYDARDGAKLGSYITAPIPAGAQAMLDVATMETAAHVTPGTGQYHYIIKAEGAFTGFLQHLVNNQRSGVITDMTTVCEM